MDKIRFAIVGSGWRSRFYIRIAKALPEQFEICSMLFRSEEKAQVFQKEYGIPVTVSKEALLKSKPNFVVVAVNKACIFEVSKEYLKLGIPVLSETPAALTLEDLTELWNMKKNEDAKLQIAEQYFLYPTYSAVIKEVSDGKLGEVGNVTISCVHDYHAVSLIHKLLGNNNGKVTIVGKVHTFPVTETSSREGDVLDGRIIEKERVRLTFEFENNKCAFYDFSGVQYRSYIRTKHMNIQGIRGEIDDFTIRYLNDKNEPQEEEITVKYNEILTEDETAIAMCMTGMKHYIETGEAFYPLAEALQDAYFSILMQEAIKTGKAVSSETQVWNL